MTAELIAQIETNQRLNIGAGNEAGYFGGMLLRLLRNLEGVDGRLVDAAVRRYLAVYDAYQVAAEDQVLVWRVAFDSGAVHQWRESLLIAQHLELGVLAHIGYDLPAAAADLCSSKDELSALKGDFSTYSKQVFAALAQAKEDVARYSPLADTLDLFGAGAYLDASARRKMSWRIAGLLVSRASTAPLILQDYDRLLAQTARRMREPGADRMPVLEFARRFELDDERFAVGDVIEAIQGGPA